MASAPGALHEARELYVIGGDGNLWSRAYQEPSSVIGGWKWVQRGAPSTPLSLVAPIKVGGSDIMVVTLDGKLATIKADSRVGFREVGWNMYESPESFEKGAPPLNLYCSDDPLSPYNCIQGYDVALQNKKKKKKDSNTMIGSVRLSQMDLSMYGLRLRVYDFDEENKLFAFYSQQVNEEKAERKQQSDQFFKSQEDSRKKNKEKEEEGASGSHFGNWAVEYYFLTMFVFFFVVL